MNEWMNVSRCVHGMESAAQHMWQQSVISRNQQQYQSAAACEALCSHLPERLHLPSVKTRSVIAAAEQNKSSAHGFIRPFNVAAAADDGGSIAKHTNSWLFIANIWSKIQVNLTSRELQKTLVSALTVCNLSAPNVLLDAWFNYLGVR